MPTTKSILVAGDVCLDVVTVNVPEPPRGQAAENWRQTGETRTHYQPGGALLLAQFIEAATPGHRVIGPSPTPAPGRPLSISEFIDGAERLTRQEIVHSILAARLFPVTSDPKEKRKVLRVERTTLGYSGPLQGDPTLPVTYAAESGDADVIVIDDTGNSFRRAGAVNRWPGALRSARATGAAPLVVYKLHRPLPGGVTDNPLWDAVADAHTRSRVVVITVSDLRSAGAPISRGLSWERTALDLVWQLAHRAEFAVLRRCPNLVIRLGLDGAVLWQHNDTPAEGQPEDTATLIYNPQGIEGTFAQGVPGSMVGSGSAFVAGLVASLTDQEAACAALTQALPSASQLTLARSALCEAIAQGLRSAQRLEREGFGAAEAPAYPGQPVFVRNVLDSDTAFVWRPIPIVVDALEADRGGWRLLNDIFEGSAGLLHRAVALVATGRSPKRVAALKQASSAEQDDVAAARMLLAAPLAEFGNLRSYDRRETEHYRALHALLRDYLSITSPKRPLSIAVFGPPGAGKGFGIKEVAKSLKGQRGCRDVEELTFNLSLLQAPDDLAGAFHLVRDVALRGKVPLVLFDEFDTPLDGQRLGWLRYFLAPMQDAEFLDRGAPHPIGQAIFVFAGGTGATFEAFRAHAGMSEAEFSAAKGPDFLSRLRATLDIPSLNLATAWGPVPADTTAPPNTFDPYGPIDAFPCEAAILLRRAGILAHNLREKAPTLVRSDDSLAIDGAVLYALLHLPTFVHGNRSFEAILDMSRLVGAADFSPSLLPAAFQTGLHADAALMQLLVESGLPYTAEERLRMAQAIHDNYIEERKAKGDFNPQEPTHRPWEELSAADRQSNLEQADDIPRKLLGMGLWLRKVAPVEGAPLPPVLQLDADRLERASRLEHDRWVAAKRVRGFVHGQKKDNLRRTHPCIVPWGDHRLSKAEMDKDRETVRAIPHYLAKAGYEVIPL